MFYIKLSEVFNSRQDTVTYFIQDNKLYITKTYNDVTLNYIVNNDCTVNFNDKSYDYHNIEPFINDPILQNILNVYNIEDDIYVIISLHYNDITFINDPGFKDAGG